MAVHTLDISVFRAAFPAFADTTIYPDAALNMWFAMATCELCPADSPVLHDDCLDTALMLLTAHIASLLTSAARGRSVTGVVTSASIDKVSTSFSVPPYTSGWQYWLSLSPYGLQLRALLSSKAAGGFYIGGMPEQHGFRRVYGVFR